MLRPGSLAPDLLKRLSLSATEFLFPAHCVWCQEEVPENTGDEGATLLCSDCCELLAPQLPHRCRRCSAPVGPFLNTDNGCTHCAGASFAFEGVVSLGAYRGELERACRACKSEYNFSLTTALTQLLAEREAETLADWDIDAIVPVPHHWIDRVRHRRQTSDLIAQRLSRVLHAPVERNLLAKVKYTRKQTSLTATERRNNLRQAFRVRGRPRLAGVRILLVDDILTTGTTAQRATRELLTAGAASVKVAVLARSLAMR